MKTLAAKTKEGITELPTVPDGRSLLAVGCSFTNEHFKSKAHPEMDCSFTKWPTILGSQLGFDNVVNLGRSGNSNDAIFKKTQDYLMNNKIDMVCVLWTTSCRLNVHDMDNINWGSTYNGRDHKCSFKTIQDFFTFKTLNIFNSEKFIDIIENNSAKLAHEHLRNIYMLNQFCKYHNIPIYHMQGVKAYRPYGFRGSTSEIDDWYVNKKKEHLNALIHSKYFGILEEQTNIYGWPFYEELGGTCVSHMLTEELIISDKDNHPNAKGHQVIADKFMKIIK
jgi:hypothetical protein